ncbi:MAG: hypothetical protein P4L40_06600 [Terracidiphilus sp.]|nr:hypothetical protein [Terracidiphilus sp.]
MSPTNGWAEVDGILDGFAITQRQLLEALAAVPVFAVAAVCPGYAAGWLTDLLGFRKRTIVERIFWSLPLSFSLMGIGGELIGRFAGLGAVTALVVLSAAVCLALAVREGLVQRREGNRPALGIWPLGGRALAAAGGWTVLVVASLVDWGHGQKLYMDMAILDQSYRVAWIEAVLRMGVPPVNPQYWLHGPAAMQNYYFWYVVCAVVARVGHLSARAVMTAGCVWSGFLLASVSGLYLKHFLEVGDRLRRQFLVVVFLLTVTGLDLLVGVAMIFGAGEMPPPDMEAWSKDGIISWLHTLLWAPHHMAGMVLCMFAFLLAWTAREARGRELALRVGWMALALASAFGISVYATLAFFLLVVFWTVRRIAWEREPRAALALAAGGACAIGLLLPYVWQLTHAAVGTHAEGGSGGGRLPLAWTVREMIPADGLLGTSVYRSLAGGHPLLALNAAKMLLLVPGYVLELGVYLVVLVVFLVPKWRGPGKLTSAQGTLVFLALAALPAMTFLRSSVLTVNDFGWRSALLMQFPLLLLTSEALMGWRLEDAKCTEELDETALPRRTPRWLRATAGLALVIGLFGTSVQALSLRFTLPMAEVVTKLPEGWVVGLIPHNTYVKEEGYAEMERVTPRNAVIQFNPWHANSYWTAADMLGANRQAAIAADVPWCGSEIGGDPSGCRAMAQALDAVFRGSSADEARGVCTEYGIGYLVATVYDPAWQRTDGWVWRLPAVVKQPEFRAVRCSE